ncbi:unnamed protein product [Soboliphyme baturini]|uniref:PH domain-containing protein n=1 Tax=Soboliphyme baturini TaxID=241478 RepID=A0A183IZ23_9BILA|nr:unnamed protein product [Soboliphyme baturini]
MSMLLTLKPQSEMEAHWQETIRDHLKAQHTFTVSSNVYLLQLYNEWKGLKEELSTKTLASEGRSNTPTIVPDFHSDSSSMQSTAGPNRHPEMRRSSVDVHYLTSSLRFSRLSPTFAKRTSFFGPDVSQSQTTLKERPIKEEPEIDCLNEKQESTVSTCALLHKGKVGSIRAHKPSLQRESFAKHVTIVQGKYVTSLELPYESGGA